MEDKKSLFIGKPLKLFTKPADKKVGGLFIGGDAPILRVDRVARPAVQNYFDQAIAAQFDQAIAAQEDQALFDGIDAAANPPVADPAGPQWAEAHIPPIEADLPAEEPFDEGHPQPAVPDFDLAADAQRFAAEAIQIGDLLGARPAAPAIPVQPEEQNPQPVQPADNGLAESRNRQIGHYTAATQQQMRDSLTRHFQTYYGQATRATSANPAATTATIPDITMTTPAWYANYYTNTVYATNAPELREAVNYAAQVQAQEVQPDMAQTSFINMPYDGNMYVSQQQMNAHELHFTSQTPLRGTRCVILPIRQAGREYRITNATTGGQAIEATIGLLSNGTHVQNGQTITVRSNGREYVRV